MPTLIPDPLNFKLLLKRQSDPKMAADHKSHTDEILVHFTGIISQAIGGCTLNVCSESQQVSIFSDHSENYCNIYNLIHGSDAGIPYVNTDMQPVETDTFLTQAAKMDPGSCVPTFTGNQSISV